MTFVPEYVFNDLGYICCADLHITDKRPHYRKDNYLETCLRKFDWIVTTANENMFRVLIAGDFFDTSSVGYDVTNPVIEILKKAKFPPIVIPGQHDMINHLEDISETPLWNLAISGHIIVIGDGANCNGVYGHQFGFKKLTDSTIGKILMVHRSITQGEPPFFLTEAISDEDAFKAYPNFKVIVAGDYHQPFHVSNGGNSEIINCGPMLRQKKDKMTLEPCVWSLVFENNEPVINKLLIPIEPPDVVFDIQAIEYDAKNNVVVDTTRLVELLGEGIDAMDFESIVYAVFGSGQFNYLTVDDVRETLKMG